MNSKVNFFLIIALIFGIYIILALITDTLKEVAKTAAQLGILLSVEESKTISGSSVPTAGSVESPDTTQQGSAGWTHTTPASFNGSGGYKYPPGHTQSGSSNWAGNNHTAQTSDAWPANHNWALSDLFPKDHIISESVLGWPSGHVSTYSLGWNHAPYSSLLGWKANHFSHNSKTWGGGGGDPVYHYYHGSQNSGLWRSNHRYADTFRM